MNGAHALQQWLPVGWLTIVDGGAAASTDAAREAVAWAVVSTLMSPTTRILWNAVRGFGRMLGGGGTYATPKGFLSGVRWIAGMGFVVAPWMRVYEILQSQGDDARWTSISMVAGAIWCVLMAADHRMAAVRGDATALLLSRGFGVFQRTSWNVPLAEVLLDAETGAPIGSPRGGRRRVRLRADVQVALDATLGAQEGRDWLRRTLVRHGLVLLGAGGGTGGGDASAARQRG